MLVGDFSCGWPFDKTLENRSCFLADRRPASPSRVPIASSAACELLSETIHRRGSSVGSLDVVIKQSDIAAGDLKRRGAMAEDALEREHVAAVR